MYSADRKQNSIVKSDLAKDIEMKKDIIPLAYNFLGDEIVEKFKYDEKKIREIVHFKMPETQNALKEELKITFRQGQRYSFKEIKHQLGLCFQKLRIELSAKASLLYNYFNVKKVKIQLADKRVDGLEIINTLFFACTKRYVMSNF